jgi:hypothetical protein
MSAIPFVQDDGGRKATGLPVSLDRHGAMPKLCLAGARKGHIPPACLRRRLGASLGLRWVPTMQIGQGCKVHLRRDELPQKGRLVLSRHAAAVIDGVLHDTYDCSRGGTRCVYGYWIFDLDKKGPVS